MTLHRSKVSALFVVLLLGAYGRPAHSQTPWLYGADPTNQAGTYTGPNPSYSNNAPANQGNWMWALHLSLPAPGPCTGLCGPIAAASPGANITVVPVLWDGPTSVGSTSCGSGSTPTVTAAELTNFYDVVTHSAYLQWVLAEYGVPNVTYAAPVSFTPEIGYCGFAFQDGGSLGIQQILQTNILNGVLPTYGAPGINPAYTIYALHFAPNEQPPTTGCGYNATSASTYWVNGSPVHYFSLPDQNAGAFASCGNSNRFNVSGWLNQTTFNESHELAENLTDPEGTGWENRVQSGCSQQGPNTGCIWPQTTGQSQIGDMCYWTNGTLTRLGDNPIVVQSLWSNLGNRCLVNGPGAPFDLNYTSASSMMVGDVGFFEPGEVTAMQDVSPGNGTLVDETVALNDANGPFDTQWERTSGVQFLSGDFDGDGLGDMALTGPAGWGTMPVATSGTLGASAKSYNGGVVASSPSPVGGGTTGVAASFTLGNGCSNGAAFTGFATAASQNPLPPVSGDFNGDGLADIAMIGGTWSGGAWGSIPIAYSQGSNQGNTDLNGAWNNGQINFWSTNCLDGGLNSLVTNNTGGRPKLVAGDFNGDGFSDLALIGLQHGSPPSPLGYIPVALSLGNGNFSVTNFGISSNFNLWAAAPAVQAVVGDFNGDGLSDIALQQCGVSGWASTPILFAAGPAGLGFGGSPGNLTQFVLFNLSNSQFASKAATAGAQLLAGDFHGDGIADLALAGGQNWSSVFEAYSLMTRVTNIATTNPVFANLISSSVPNFSYVTSPNFYGSSRPTVALSAGEGL